MLAVVEARKLGQHFTFHFVLQTFKCCMNRFCSVTECHVCCYLPMILNGPATVGSAAKGHTSLGDRAPFPLLLA